MWRLKVNWLSRARLKTTLSSVAIYGCGSLLFVMIAVAFTALGAMTDYYLTELAEYMAKHDYRCGGACLVLVIVVVVAVARWSVQPDRHSQ